MELNIVRLKANYEVVLNCCNANKVHSAKYTFVEICIALFYG